MSQYADRHCTPCEGGLAPLAREQAVAALAQLAPGWELGAAAGELARRFTFKDFYRTMSFVNAIAHIANREDHHPDLKVGYGYCEVVYRTHAIDGLSDNDFICAAKIDLLIES
ncbi:MAG: 4a-hydroxytetrahydrobiopterin dehydratase [Steroidobacteraceae bacterium]